uniref:Uncharacterized protein n=1 Tax=Onchocerca volvulus TaxID=6282 RepID=A0A8R1XYN0_ONCVO
MPPKPSAKEAKPFFEGYINYELIYKRYFRTYCHNYMAQYQKVRPFRSVKIKLPSDLVCPLNGQSILYLGDAANVAAVVLPWINFDDMYMNRSDGAFQTMKNDLLNAPSSDQKM